jgi:protease-4
MVFKSGKFKDMLSGSRPPEEIPAEEKKMMQAMIDETYGRFQSVVEKGRKAAEKSNSGKGRALQANWKEFADGRILSGKQALELGLVDELGNFDAAVRRARNIAGLGSANLVRYEQPFGFGRMFRLFGKTDAKTVKIDLGAELPKLLPGRLYFLYPAAM